MAQPHANNTAGNQPESSQHVVEDRNPAVFKQKWLVIDDINIDLLSVLATFSAVVAVLLGYPAKAVVPITAALVLPLRTFLPHPAVPQGLVLVTGGSSGIGAELSYIFASKGHDLVLVGRSDEQLEAVHTTIETRYGRKVYTVATDLSLPGAAKKLYDQIKGQGLTVDVLVNAAALGAAGDTMDQPLELVERMTTLNCTALVQLTQLFGRDMMSRRQGGWILQVSSVLGKSSNVPERAARANLVIGWMSSPGQNVYHATKHYVRSFCEALSVELRAHPNVVMTQLMPGPVRTQFVTRAHAEDTFIFAASHTVEEPSAVARAGYQGLCKRKRMVFSSWNAAFTATLMYLLPRSVHLTLARLTNAPMHGLVRASEPDHDQKARAEG